MCFSQCSCSLWYGNITEWTLKTKKTLALVRKAKYWTEFNNVLKNLLRPGTWMPHPRHWKDYVLSMWCLWNYLIYAVHLDCVMHTLADWPCWSSYVPVDRLSMWIILCACWLSMWIMLCTCWQIVHVDHVVYLLTDCPWCVPADWLSMFHVGCVDCRTRWRGTNCLPTGNTWLPSLWAVWHSLSLTCVRGKASVNMCERYGSPFDMC